MLCDPDSKSGLHVQATLMVFLALGLPTAFIIGSKGSEYWLTGIETGAVVGGIGAVVFYVATGGNIFQAVVGDAASIFTSSACAVLHEIGLL